MSVRRMGKIDTANKPRSTRWMKTFVVVCIVAFWAMVPWMDIPARFDRVYTRLTGEPAKIDATPGPVAEIAEDRVTCDAALPAHGRQVTYATGVESALHSRVYVANEHVFPMLLIFSDPATGTRDRAVMLHPQQAMQLQIPVGHYGLTVQTGASWCNLGRGFVDGEEVAAPQQMEVKASEVTNLRLISYGDSASDIMFSYGKSLGVLAGGAAQRPEGVGTLDLQRVVGGHFAVEGSINQVPAHFLVDTGATFVSVPAAFAAHAGIHDCERSRTNTANGVVDVCLGTARELTLGQFRLKNVRVSYHQSLGDTFLLGMNVIGQFHMEQQGDVMRLSLH